MHAGGNVEQRLAQMQKYNDLAELTDVLLQELVRLHLSNRYEPSEAMKHCMGKAHRILTEG